MTGTKLGGARPRIPEDVKAAILAADASVPHSDLARKYGISDVSVYTIRKAAGIVLIKSNPAETPVKKKAAKKKVKRVAERVDPAEAEPVEDGSPESLECAIIIPICRAEDIFAEFTPSEKALAIQSVLQERMDSALT